MKNIEKLNVEMLRTQYQDRGIICKMYIHDHLYIVGRHLDFVGLLIIFSEILSIIICKLAVGSSFT